ncbi:MAG: hypothetical protein GY703_00955 [Gammaproteobacteria bacterium]|nr:hypothetical protein [Gammaproteobacteria bacterium]
MTINKSIISLLLAGLFLAGCSTLGHRPGNQGPVDIQLPSRELSEQELLDVWIEVFEPGQIDPERDKTVGTNLEIRKAESRFVPVQLKKTLQRTGHWGAVRVVPDGTVGGELIVSGEILASDGEILELWVVARDSTGQEWLDKTYLGVVDSEEYDLGSWGKYDAFQSTYNKIANDLAKARQKLSPQQLTSVRQVAELQFAADLSPDPFKNYVQTTEEGRYSARRLPARDDPMMQRVRAIRERDYLFIDTVNDHYDTYYRDMWEPYGNWRRFNQEEIENLRQVEKEAMTRKILGIGAVVGAIALGMAGSSDVRANTDSLRQVMVLGGMMVARSGFEKDSEKQIHIDAMQELGVSFESEATPMVVEVDDQTHRLTGSVETQYAQWRDLLQKIHQSETGFSDVTIR